MPTLLRGRGFDSDVALTAHFNDASSTNCRWAPGNEGSFSLDSAPVDTAQFACRMSIFVTQATPAEVSQPDQLAAHYCK